jgi:hypothetical protein
VNARVFVSSAAADNEVAAAVTTQLTRLLNETNAAGIEIGTASGTRRPPEESDAPLSPEAVAEIQVACLFVVLLSRSWLASKRCLGELACAARNRVKIEILTLDDIARDDRPQRLQHLSALQLYRAATAGTPAHVFTPDSAEFRGQIGVLTRVVQRAARPRPVPPPPILPPPPPPDAIRSDRVAFSVFAPAIARPRSSFVVSVWASLADAIDESERDAPRASQRAEMLRRASAGGRLIEAGTRPPVRIPSSSELAIAIDLPDFDVAEPVDVFTWEGEIAQLAFVVRAGDVAPGSYPGTARVSRFGLLLTRIVFEITIGTETVEQPVRRDRPQRNIRSAFASYASADRHDVLQRVQGIRATGVDVFLDVLTMRAADDWESQLMQAIRERDVLYLFWSPAARDSQWVDREWRAGLAERGLDFIWPVPLTDPRDAPPPEELRSRHFNDDILAHIEVERERPEPQSRQYAATAPPPPPSSPYYAAAPPPPPSPAHYAAAPAPPSSPHYAAAPPPPPSPAHYAAAPAPPSSAHHEASRAGGGRRIVTVITALAAAIVLGVAGLSTHLFSQREGAVPVASEPAPIGAAVPTSLTLNLVSLNHSGVNGTIGIATRGDSALVQLQGVPRGNTPPLVVQRGTSCDAIQPGIVDHVENLLGGNSTGASGRLVQFKRDDVLSGGFVLVVYGSTAANALPVACAVLARPPQPTR